MSDHLSKLAEKAVIELLRTPDTLRSRETGENDLRDDASFYEWLSRQLIPISSSLEFQRLAAVSESLRPLELVVQVVACWGRGRGRSGVDAEETKGQQGGQGTIELQYCAWTVVQAADTLGVPYGGPVGSSMLWIADAALCPLLPLGWHEWTLDDQGDATSYGEVSYYQNVLTGQTTWEHPQ
ncbi:MAG: hypothetical protein SGPRY_009370, partial [Prymnesium sp.]